MQENWDPIGPKVQPWSSDFNNPETRRGHCIKGFLTTLVIVIDIVPEVESQIPFEHEKFEVFTTETNVTWESEQI